MSMNKIIVVFVFTVLCGLFTGCYCQGPVDDYCLNCICQQGCAITYDFWIDAGKPTVNGDLPTSVNAFNNCYEDYYCSSRAIQNYMYRYQKDCNDDGQIDCLDHAAIHQHGASGCAGKDNDVFQFQVYNCLNKRR